MPITGAPLPVNACFLAFPRNVIDGSLDVAVPAVNHFNSNLSDILLIPKHLRVIFSLQTISPSWGTIGTESLTLRAASDHPTTQQCTPPVRVFLGQKYQHKPS